MNFDVTLGSMMTLYTTEEGMMGYYVAMSRANLFRSFVPSKTIEEFKQFSYFIINKHVMDFVELPLNLALTKNYEEWSAISLSHHNGFPLGHPVEVFGFRSKKDVAIWKLNGIEFQATIEGSDFDEVIETHLSESSDLDI